LNWSLQHLISSDGEEDVESVDLLSEILGPNQLAIKGQQLLLETSVSYWPKVAARFFKLNACFEEIF
jgi:hypothetical protein